MRVDLKHPEDFKNILEQVTKQSIQQMPSGITLDSREVIRGDLFIAIQGEKVDGHQFLKAAQEKGCSVAMVKQRNPQIDLPQIEVADPATTIAQIAKKWRSNFTLPVIGITGSNGKTTTKDLLIQIFSATFHVHGTRGNYNTRLGLPLTLLELTSLHTLSFLEMGANETGDIGYLCNLSKPSYGLITNIAPAHLEGFGSLENVAKTKEELFISLPEDGIAFVNEDDEWIKSMSTPAHRITFGTSPKCDFTADIHRDDRGLLTLIINGEEITLNSYDETYAKNVIAASAVSITLGISWESFQNMVLNFSPPPGRCLVKNSHGITYIDDTYNANLTSTLSALNLLFSLPSKGKRIMIFGDMLELGEKSAEHHHQVGKRCAELGVDHLLCYGNEIRSTIQAANNQVNVQTFASKSELASSLKDIVHPGDVLLFKGSRGMEMETIIQDLFEE